MRGQLLPPVVALTCICPEVEDVRPIKINSNIVMNFETGLFHHNPGCGRPLPSMIQNCNGCFENFWGYRKDLVCKECKPYF